jgi:uncharacterized protein (DUF433 family)
VRGTRTPVWVIVAAFRETGDVAQTGASFKHLTHEQIRGALDYYDRFPARVDEDFERNARALAEVQQRQCPA